MNKIVLAIVVCIIAIGEGHAVVKGINVFSHYMHDTFIKAVKP